MLSLISEQADYGLFQTEPKWLIFRQWAKTKEDLHYMSFCFFPASVIQDQKNFGLLGYQCIEDSKSVTLKEGTHFEQRPNSIQQDRLVVSFRFIKECSTAMKIVKLRFGSKEPIFALSEKDEWHSSPAIIIPDSAKEVLPAEIKLIAHCYKGSEQEYCNLLINHFQQKVENNLGKAEQYRPSLTLTDTKLLLRKLGQNKDPFKVFWTWFNGIEDTILKFKKLWCRNYIYGFVEGQEAVALLENQSPGTFMIRFSGSDPRALVINTILPTSECKQYKFCDNDFANEDDFIRVLENPRISLYSFLPKGGEEFQILEKEEGTAHSKFPDYLTIGQLGEIYIPSSKSTPGSDSSPTQSAKRPRKEEPGNDNSVQDNPKIYFDFGDNTIGPIEINSKDITFKDVLQELTNNADNYVIKFQEILILKIEGVKQWCHQKNQMNPKFAVQKQSKWE